MFAYIKGTLTALSESIAVVEAGGIGYEILITRRDATELVPLENQDIRLYTHLNIKEDSHTIFGFLTPQTKQIFLTLLSVSGIGPKLGLTILAELTSDQLIQAILSNNLSLIVSIPGIGKKTAERLVLELKDKFKNTDLSGLVVSGGKTTPSHNEQITSEINQALSALGYSSSEIRKMIQSVAGDLKVGDTIETAITLILRNQSRL